MLCARGHQLSKPAVNTSKARSTLAFTVIVLSTGATGSLVTIVILPPRTLCLCRLLERGERVSPEFLEVAAQAVDARGVQSVQPAVADRLIDHEMGVLEHTQVLRDGGAADGKRARELTNRDRAVEQTFENRPARGIAQRGQLGVHRRMLVSIH